MRSVVLTGAGPAFCAGGDLKAMRERTGMFAGDPAELRTRYRLGLQQLPRRFDAFEKPVVAAVGGAAIGAGLDLALMADCASATARPSSAPPSLAWVSSLATAAPTSSRAP